MVLPEALVPVVAADVDAAGLPAATVLLDDELDVVVVVAPAGTVVLLPEEVVVVLAAPRVWPKAWKTASMKDLKLLAGFEAPCVARLPSLSPSLSCDDVLLTGPVALVPVTLYGVDPLAPTLPYAVTFIVIPFTRCAIDRAGRDINGFVARDRMWSRFARQMA